MRACIFGRIGEMLKSDNSSLARPTVNAANQEPITAPSCMPPRLGHRKPLVAAARQTEATAVSQCSRDGCVISCLVGAVTVMRSIRQCVKVTIASDDELSDLNACELLDGTA
jgi:hypothetical protein